MPRFYFHPTHDQLIDLNLATECEMAMWGSGVCYIPGMIFPNDARASCGRRLPTEADVDPARKERRRPTPQDLFDRFGKQNCALWATGKHWRNEQEWQHYHDLMHAAESQGAACRQALVDLREHHHRGCDIADWRDGPGEYTAAVEQCVRRHFPPRMTLARLRDELGTYRSKLLFLVNGRGPIGPAERGEMHDRVKFCDYWCERLGFLDAPTGPPLGEQTPHKVRNHLKAVAAFLATKKPEDVRYTDPEGRPFPNFDLAGEPLPSTTPAAAAPPSAAPPAPKPPAGVARLIAIAAIKQENPNATQEEAAGKLGISPGTFSKWLRDPLAAQAWTAMDRTAPAAQRSPNSRYGRTQQDRFRQRSDENAA